MKLLVTGGAGFIGSNFIYYIQKHYPNDSIVCLDALTYAGNFETLLKANKAGGFKFIKGDITDRGLVYELFSDEKFDVVVNFAAESHVDRSITGPDVFVRTNVLGTQTLLDAVREFNVPRFHQVSTDEVYGDLPLDAPDLFFTEDTPLSPSSPYSASKAAADMLALAYHRTYGVNVTISRCTNNYGPFQFPEKLIPLITINALSERKLPVYGTGLNVRDWLCAEDHCGAIDIILRKAESGKVYNVGGNNERANIDVVKKILSCLGKPESLIEYVDDRKGHDLRYAINPERIQKELGWSPKTSFDEGIEQTIEWYVNNRSWWERILSGEHKNSYSI